MRFLPFSLLLGVELKQAIRAAHQDPRRRAFCACCGGEMLIVPDRVAQRARCPRCWRWQEVAATEESPWRLSAGGAAALRETRRWLRG